MNPRFISDEVTAAKERGLNGGQSSTAETFEPVGEKHDADGDA
jgi:hypothetical protein